MEKIDLTKYKGATVEYFCEDCKTGDNFFEDFDSNLSKIKSDSCSHYNFKFIYNFEENKELKYIISFNCINCSTNKIITLFDKNTTDISPRFEYKCEKCKKGKLIIRLLLCVDKEIDIEDDVKQNNNSNVNKSYVNDNNDNRNNFDPFFNGTQLMNDNVIGGQRQINPINNNNFNNIFNNNNFNNNNFNNNFNNNNFNNNFNNNNFNNNFNNNNFNNIFNNNYFNNNFNNNNFNNNFNNNNFNNNFNNNNFNNNFNNNNNNNFNNIMINNLMPNQMYLKNNMDNNMNNDMNNNSIKIKFKETKGPQYEMFVSPDTIFAEVVRNLLNQHKEIDGEKIGAFILNSVRVRLHSTVKENNIENNSIIMITFLN